MPLILTVEDSAAMRQMVEVALTSAGYDVLQARDGREAGATGWIVKPFNPEKFLATVAKVLK